MLASLLLLTSVGNALAQTEGQAVPAAPVAAAPVADETPSLPPPVILPATAPTAPSSAPAASPPDRWFLMKALQGTWEGSQLDTNRMQISGWTDVSYTFSSDQASNLPMGFNYRANEFLLQQNWVRFERQVVTTGTEPSWGFRNDWILPGSDYIFTLPRGIFNSQLTANDGLPNRYGIDPIQFYLEAYVPTIAHGMDIKFGRFFSQYGIESNAAVDNYFLSHAYGMIYDPFTNTGLLTTTKLTDEWSVQAGLTLGSDDFIDPVDNATFVGSVKWAPPTGWDSVLFAVIAGEGRFNQSRNFHNPEVFDLVYTHKVDARTNYLFEGLFGFTTNVPDIGTANWWMLLQYLTHDFTPRLTGVVRYEIFDDAQGQRTGFEGVYSALTAGVQFRPRKSIILRPEVRYDYNFTSKPFDNRHGLFTLASDLIIRW
jgi:hypothetical protein